MTQIYNCYTSLQKYGGAELIAINLTKGLTDISGVSELLLFNKTKPHSSYNIKDLKINYFSWTYFFRIKSSDIIFSHHRKITTLLLILRLIFFKKFRLIHIAHNEFYNLRYFTFFPLEIIAVSNRVKQNLIDYFKIQPQRIKVIYNGIEDFTKSRILDSHNDYEIKILYPARITEVKQQIEIVKNLKYKINSNITIYFAGEGDLTQKLLLEIDNNNQFKYIGFIDISNEMKKFDYVMLFSKVEGLPTVFIEACMYSKPIICNNVGGNLEILQHGINGFLANKFSELISTLNNLPNSKTKEYNLMSENARIIYENCFTIEKMIGNYKKIITND